MSEKVFEELRKSGLYPEDVLQKAERLMDITHAIDAAMTPLEPEHDEVLAALGGMIAQRAKDALDLVEDLNTLTDAAMEMFEIRKKVDTVPTKKVEVRGPAAGYSDDMRAQIEETIRKDLNIPDDTKIIFVN